MAQSSSGHDDVSASTEELEEYKHASKVNVSNFVSVKLSGQSNYHIWKAQILSLLDRLMIRDIVENRDAWLKSKSKDIAKKYDILLKGWILGSLDEELLRHIDYSDDVQSIWWTLANDHDNVSASNEELEEYMNASNVNVSNFVSVKLSGQRNYPIWKAQMLSLLDKLMIRDIVENRGDWLKSKSKDIAKKYDILLKGWILGSLDLEVLIHLDFSDDVQSIWWTLLNYHDDVSASKEELEEYMNASNANVSNFVSVKLSGESNYHIWKAQMLSLLDKLMIRDIVENPDNWLKAKSKDITKRYNILLKGWILGSLNEELLRHFDYSANVQSIWRTLESEYCFYGYPREMVLIKVRAEDYNYGGQIGKLRDATREGNWWRAQSILRKHRIQITRRINYISDETMLHLAVGEGKNYFVQKLLNSIQNEDLIYMTNNKDQTALHIAALVGNEYAAELLVKKRDYLLYVKDKSGEVPLLIAYSNNHISTFAYLFEVTKTADELLPTYQDSFEEFIIRLIHRKEYGLAFKLYKFHLKSTQRPTDKVLMAITRNFPSDVSIGEALIYPSWENACQNIVKRNSLLFNSFDYLCERAENTLWRMKRFKNNYYSWLLPEIVMLLLVPIAVAYPLYQLILLFISMLLLPVYMLYSLLWKLLATVVVHMKNIEKRKKEYEEANYFLRNTVHCMDSFNLDNSRFYKFTVLEAVRLDVYEVLSLILRHFNQTIEYTSERHCWPQRRIFVGLTTNHNIPKYNMFQRIAFVLIEIIISHHVLLLQKLIYL